MTRIVPVLFVMAIFGGAAASSEAQRHFPPKSFENLQVLAKGSSTGDVINTMKGFTGALGVRCQHCHAGKEGMPLDQFDFVSDEVPEKKTARLMMRMMADVNRQLDESLPKAASAGARVSCQTCHRGQAKPSRAAPRIDATLHAMHREELLIRPVAHMAPDQVIAGLSSEDAIRRVPGITHSIVEIVAHMVFWQAWFLDRCSGIPVPPAAHAAEGWPAVTAADWGRVRDQFLEDLRRAVEHPATGRIEPPLEHPPMADYGVEDALTHVAQHNAHHLGQIVTLRQALGLWPPPGGSYTW